MSTEVGLRTQYLNWREHFPDDLDIEPVWIVIDFWREGGIIERLPIPKNIRGRIRGYFETSAALNDGPYDATFIAVHSVLAGRPDYARHHPCYATFDVTPKQLQAFGDYYGKSASRIPGLENIKHQGRATSYRQCRLLFPWSNWAASSAVDDYGAERDRVRICPPGVDLTRWAPPAAGTRGNGDCRLLFVGGDFERKGGDVVLEWAKSTREKHWRLDIVTRKPLKVDDSRIVVHNNLSSNDPDLVKLYNQADLFVLPTFADCYSIAGIEAMASGLPVILGSVGGTPDIIKDGETGYLVPPGDPSALADRLERLIGDARLRRSMGDAARADAEERYDVKANIRNTLLMIKESL
ncbi:MAG TPA: glycosyltransferase family 4 protein [Capsulimonadaceae bacterium]|jgi:glycosyltransferase involved in cell wall biosynthesis